MSAPSPWQKLPVKHALLILIILQVGLIFVRDWKDANRKLPLPLKQVLNITGRVLESSDTFRGSRIVVKPEGIPFAGWRNNTDLIQLNVGDRCQPPAGATIHFKTKLSQPKVFLNPGVFDERAHLRRQGIMAGGYVPYCRDVSILNQTQPSFFQKSRNSIKTEIASLPLKHGDQLLKLTLGNKTQNPDTKELIRNAGLAHLFTISGLHFGMMSTMLYFLAGFFLKWFTPPFNGLPRQKISALVALVFVIVYTLVTNDHPSIRRSAIMITLYLLGILLDRQKNLWHVFQLAILGDLILYPFDLFQLSFQLSYLCVGILILISPKVVRIVRVQEWGATPWNRKRHNIILKKISGIIITGSLISLLLGPLLAASFGETNLNGILHNLWAIPFFEFLVMPVGLIYLGLSLTGIPGTSLILHVWDRILNVFFKILQEAAAWQADPLAVPDPHGIHILLFYMTAFAFACFRKKSIGFCFMLLFIISLGHTAINNQGFDLRLTQIDVGQGDAILIETKSKKILIDTGGNRFFDVGDKVTLPFLKYRWISKLDLVVITHADLDHYGGLDALLNKIKIGRIWINDFPASNRMYQDLMNDIRAMNIPLHIQNRNRAVPLDDKTTIEILSPTPDLTPPKNDNDHSVVLRLTQGDFCALFTGDISKKMEKKLVRAYGKSLKCFWLKVAHHGSANGSSAEFLDAVDPKVAVIGVGRDSQFGHPRPETLIKLERAGATVFRTDRHGMIMTTVKDGGVKIRTFVEDF